VLAGWSPDGRWILYRPGPVGASAGPRDAVPASGAGWMNLWGNVLPDSDLLSPCGAAVAITAGTGTGMSVGKQIFLTGPPGWRFRDLTDDPSRSWFWPACSPRGRWVAATDTLDQPETSDQTVPRGSVDPCLRRLLPPPPGPGVPGGSGVPPVVGRREGDHGGGSTGHQVGISGEPIPPPDQPTVGAHGAEARPAG
jgi:hypothetical protein